MEKYQEVNNEKRKKFEGLCIPTMEGFDIIKTYSVLYLQSEGAYTKFFTHDDKVIVSTKNIGFYEKILIDEAFIRIHNSFMVNMQMVVKYIRGDDGYVVLRNKKILKVSRGRKDELFDFFNRLYSQKK